MVSARRGGWKGTWTPGDKERGQEGHHLENEAAGDTGASVPMASFHSGGRGPSRPRCRLLLWRARKGRSPRRMSPRHPYSRPSFQGSSLHAVNASCDFLLGGRILLHWEFEDSCLWGRGGQMEANTERGLTQGSHILCATPCLWTQSHACLLWHSSAPPPNNRKSVVLFLLSMARQKSRGLDELIQPRQQGAELGFEPRPLCFFQRVRGSCGHRRTGHPLPTAPCPLPAFLANSRSQGWVPVVPFPARPPAFST